MVHDGVELFALSPTSLTRNGAFQGSTENGVDSSCFLGFVVELRKTVEAGLLHFFDRKPQKLVRVFLPAEMQVFGNDVQLLQNAVRLNRLLLSVNPEILGHVFFHFAKHAKAGYAAVKCVLLRQEIIVQRRCVS